MKVLLIIGTRPEAIKLAPVYFELQKRNIPVKICATFQHSTLLQEVFDIFGITPDYNLDVMKAGQDISYLTQVVLDRTKAVFEQEKPTLVLVQGDTTTAFASALSAYYLKIPVGHVEAGLRTNDIYSPFPEELNRQAISLFAEYNFAPTDLAVKALMRAGILGEVIHNTGNTIVDSLQLMKKKIAQGSVSVTEKVAQLVQECGRSGQKKILLTVHRRESFNGGINHILRAVKEYALENPDVFVFYPYHPNPHVLKAIEEVGLSEVENIYLTKPLAYSDLVYLLLNIDLVITDSGGIQEEAVSLGKTVLVAREKTERMEGVQAGIAHLVGTDTQKIKQALKDHIHVQQHKETQIYGNGDAAEKIVIIIERKWMHDEKSLCRRTGVHRTANSDNSC